MTNRRRGSTTWCIDLVPAEAASSSFSPRCEAAASELIEEHRRADLSGATTSSPATECSSTARPGNGKTSLAEAIAAETMLPFYVCATRGSSASFLGETASRLDQAFEFARTRRCVLFFDEFDTIAKERRTPTRPARSKRVVSTLLLQIDRLPHM